MMRPSLRPLTALKLGASASVIVFAVWALAAGPGVDASHGTAPASGASTAGGRAAIAGAAVRRWQLTLAPAPDDLALAQVSFAHANGVGVSARSLRVAVTGPFGDDYMVAGASHSSTGVRRALVLLVNRPSPLLDPSSVTLSLSALRALGEPAVRKLADAFAQKAAAPTPALCDLPLHGAPLSGSRAERARLARRPAGRVLRRERTRPGLRRRLRPRVFQRLRAGRQTPAAVGVSCAAGRQSPRRRLRGHARPGVSTGARGACAQASGRLGRPLAPIRVPDPPRTGELRDP